MNKGRGMDGFQGIMPMGDDEHLITVDDLNDSLSPENLFNAQMKDIMILDDLELPPPEASSLDLPSQLAQVRYAKRLVLLCPLRELGARLRELRREVIEEGEGLFAGSRRVAERVEGCLELLVYLGDLERGVHERHAKLRDTAGCTDGHPCDLSESRVHEVQRLREARRRFRCAADDAGTDRRGIVSCRVLT